MAGDNLDDARAIVTRGTAKALGLKRYFTGKKCPKGHRVERWTSSCGCIICAGDSLAKWRDENTEAVAASWRAYYEKNRGDRPRRRIPDLEAIAIKARARTKAWLAANPERARQLQREKNARHPEKLLARTRNYRARKRGAEGCHAAADIARIRAAQKDRCANPACRKPLKGKGHVDHIQSLAKGGSNWPRNLQLLCGPCNCAKTDRDPIEFVQSKGFLL